MSRGAAGVLDDVAMKARIVVCSNLCRTLEGVAQKAVAEKFKVSQGTVSRWLSGRTTPSVDTLAKIAAWRGVPFYSLVKEIDTWRKS